jgi:hypothetical protein
MGKGFWLATAVLLLALLGGLGTVVFLQGKQSRPDGTAPESGPSMAPAGESGETSRTATAALAEKPEVSAGPERDFGGLRIVQGPDGPVITDGKKEGTIQKKDGQILLTLHQEKALPSAVPAPDNAPPPAPGPAPAGKKAQTEAEAVNEYFLRLAMLQKGPTGLSPQMFAERMVGDIARGDMSQLDEMVQNAESAREEAGRISPPAPCAEIHRKTLALMDDSVRLMHDFRDSLKAQNVANLQALELAARRLMTRTRELELMQEAIRQRYGSR